MPIASSDLKAYSAANVPEDDVSTSGGAIALTSQPDIAQMAASDTLSVVSSDAGDTTQTVTVTGRNAAGAILADTKTLNGTTPVSITGTFERVLKVVLSGTTTGNVTLSRATGGATVALIEAGQTKSHVFFQRSASEASSVERYEKFFWKNTHGSLSLNDAEVTLTADPASRIKIALATSKDDSGSVANRKTAPGGLSFSDDSVDLAVPTGALAAGEAIGVWVEQDLLADDSPIKNTFTTQLAGTSV